MKIEDAIKVLSGPYHFIDGPYWKEIDEAVRAILPAAEKRIPKPPNGDLETPWTCPNCGTHVFHEQQRMYCRQCGQLIAWDKLR